MAKFFVESTEIEIKEKRDVEELGHKIEGKYYMVDTLVTNHFKSAIFSYQDISVLVKKAERFGEMYYKIVLFSDASEKAWKLITLSARLNTKVRRLSEDTFLVIGESPSPDLLSQVSFCKMKPSTKVDEITLNFSKLIDIRFLKEGSILLNYTEEGGLNAEKVTVLSMYNYDGKLLRNFYEFAESDQEKYSYALEDGKIKIIKI